MTSDEKKKQDQQTVAIRKTAPLPGTIGAACYLDGMQKRFVQGYGLVAGLPGTGSGECPESLRKQLVATIARYQKLYGDSSAQQLPPGGFFNTHDTAVVKVIGTIPAGSLKGDHFDLAVQALPNTGTTSLEGGRLYTCDLRIYAGPVGQTTASHILAQGSGPIFINPFEKQKYRGSQLLHRGGYVLNGGTNIEDRRIFLMLASPSYPAARAIEQKINSVFGPPADNPLWQTAKASGYDRIELRIPRQYHNRLFHFLGLVRNIYIRSDPSYIETQANDLTKQIGGPLANAPDIAYAWEAMGRSVLPMIQPLYTSPNKQASFYSAKAGAGLGDTLAMEQLGFFAADPKSKFRQKAVQTLGFCRDSEARKILRKILDDRDIDLRILAYEGLARMDDVYVERIYVGEDNFALDTVQSNAWPMVYATREQQSKIVLFGKNNLEPPIFYCHPDNSITMSADSGAKQIALLRQTPSGKSSGKITASLDLQALITLMGNDSAVDKKTGKVYGLGLPYSHIVAILNQLCKNGSIPAKFKMQDLQAVSEPPDDIIGRPEKD
ncbi:MAG: flagellar basal body P-ring protein FlgI [Phycisphaerae bacterium]